MTGRRTIIETSGGRFFDFANPSAESIDFRDVARALSHIARFGGHTKKFYSVAEHALLVRHIVIDSGRPELALAALHHDSHEAYVGDLVTPLKNALAGAHEEIVDQIDRAIAAKLGLRPSAFHHSVIRAADEQALRIEASALKTSRGISGAWPYRTLPEAAGSWSRAWHPKGPQSTKAVRRAFLRAHNLEMKRRA